MDPKPYDRSGKWLVDHYGDAILRLGGFTDVVSWRPRPGEVVQPRQLPDGLLDVRFAGRRRAVPVVVEIATYPDARVARQVVRDALLVYLDRDVLPEVLVLVLHPKGQLAVDTRAVIHSRLRRARLTLGWEVVGLWTRPAEELLAVAEGDVGRVPWAVLGAPPADPLPFLRRCREAIEGGAAAERRDNLLAVSIIFGMLRYDEATLYQVFGGRQGMLEIASP